MKIVNNLVLPNMGMRLQSSRQRHATAKLRLVHKVARSGAGRPHQPADQPARGVRDEPAGAQAG